MKITLGENIRNLRNEQYITQEQLAEALGVSPQAVSRWENETTYPDILILPAIANFFDVTTDFLLGVDVVHKQEEIDRILKTDMEFANYGKTEERIKLMKESLETYPNEGRLLHNLAAALFSYYFIGNTKHSEEEKNKGALEIIATCKKAMKYSQDTSINDYCKRLMILSYTKIKEFDKAAEIAETLSQMWCSKELIKPEIYIDTDKKKASELFQHSLIMCIDETNHCIDMVRWLSGFSVEEKLEISKLQENFLLSFLGDKPLFYNDRLYNTAECQCYYNLQLGEKEECLNALERAYKYAEGFEERPEVGKYTVHWLSALEDRLDEITRHNTKTYYEDLLEFIHYRKLHEIYKGDERLKDVMCKLKQKIEKSKM